MANRWYQDEALQAIWNYFGTHTNGSVLLALPTASGKSRVIAEAIRRMFLAQPNVRVMVCTHVKELVQQDYDELREVWPNAPAGINSAGLKRRDTLMPITFASIKSVVNHAENFGHIDVLMVDECHLISGKDNTQYGRLVDRLRQRNPLLSIIGFTATPYRMGQGLLTDGPLFDEVIYDLTTIESFNRLITEGYLALPIPKRTGTQLDIGEVGLSGGDFNKEELQHAVDKQDVNWQACRELVQYGQHRSSWMVFATGVEHTIHISDILNQMGIPSAAVYDKMGEKQRDQSIKDFKLGHLRCLVNYGVLTTGFNHPGIDCIGMMRPTMSTGLWVQMVGRGMRPAPNKENCLVLDFAGNTARLGPINDPVIPSKPGKRTKPGVLPVRICPRCDTYNHVTTRYCVECGYEFPKAGPVITAESDTRDLVVSTEPLYDRLTVKRVMYHKMMTRTDKPYIRVTYVCGLAELHTHDLYFDPGMGELRHKAREWWRKRPYTEVPETTDEALKTIMHMPVPKEITVWKNKRYPEIVEETF